MEVDGTEKESESALSGRELPIMEASKQKQAAAPFGDGGSGGAPSIGCPSCTVPLWGPALGADVLAGQRTVSKIRREPVTPWL